MKIKGYRIPLFLAVTVALLSASCNKGISPEPEFVETGFGGTIYFFGEWPEGVERTHLVLFKDPLIDSTDFSAVNLRFVSNEIPYGSTEFKYSSISDILIGNIQPGEYAYLAVAQSDTQELSFLRKDWYVVGLYSISGSPDVPAKLIIPPNTFVNNIDIICDFNNPPPQPPGGF